MKGRMIAMKLNPVYKKELKTSVRGIKLPLFLLVYNLLLAVISLTAFYMIFGARYGDSGVQYSKILTLYQGMALGEFSLILLAVPAFTSGAVAGEREKQTLDLLLSSCLTPGAVIRGKLLSSISSILLLILSGVPMLSLVFAVGGVHLADLAELFIFFICTAFFVGSIGIFFSVVMKRTVAATVASYGTVLFLSAATFGCILGVQLLVRHSYEIQYYASGGEGVYQEPGVGYLLCLLYVNPFVSLFNLLEDQVGSPYAFQRFLQQYGRLPGAITCRWLEISLTLQMLLALLLLYISTKRLGLTGRSSRWERLLRRRKKSLP